MTLAFAFIKCSSCGTFIDGDEGRCASCGCELRPAEDELSLESVALSIRRGQIAPSQVFSKHHSILIACIAQG